MNKSKELAKKYSLFIEHYESYLKKDSQKVEELLKDMNELAKNIYMTIKQMNEEKFCPWRMLPSEHIEDELSEIFESDLRKTDHYTFVLESITDDFIFPAVEELEKYYEENNKQLDYEEQLFDIVHSYNTKEELDLKIFSKSTIDFFDIYKEAERLENELLEYRKNLEKNVEKEELEEIEK